MDFRKNIITHWFGKTKGMAELVDNIYSDFLTKVPEKDILVGREFNDFFKAIYPEILKNITSGDFFQKNGELSDDEINLFLASYKEYIPQVNINQSSFIQPYRENLFKIECFERQMRENGARNWSGSHWTIPCEGDFNEIKKKVEIMKPFIQLRWFTPSVFYMISTILTEIKENRDLYPQTRNYPSGPGGKHKNYRKHRKTKNRHKRRGKGEKSQKTKHIKK
jgi:hypothetical protein